MFSKSLKFLQCAALLLFAFTSPAAAASNQLTVTERSGTDYVALGGYPWQIGRPFGQGEIPGEPEVLANGVSVPIQQATVKTRWPDGSAKFAVIQARLPIQANAAVTVTFQSRAPRSLTGLSKAAMLAMNFNSEIKLTSGGVTKIASARTMLSAGHYTVWTQGPAATSVIIADHSATRAYDMGFTEYKPFRPIFHATFWPGWGVEVRAIGELANSIELQDVTADVAVTVGDSSPTTIVSEAAVAMQGQTRWSRRGWITRTPGKVDHDYGLAYLAAVKAIPNYDASLKVPASRIAALYTNYQALAKGLYAQSNSGGWHKPMSDVGGRPDLGPFPMWYVVWMYSGDWRMAEYCNFLSEQYGSLVNGHTREGAAGKTFEGSTDGLGRVLSINARPTISLWHPETVLARDKITYIQPFGQVRGLGYETEHVPHPYPIHYLLTGEFFALEQLWFAGSTELAHITYPFRGPSGSGGGIYSTSPRSTAWAGVARFEAAYFSPDGTAEAAYFRAKSEETVQAFDGLLGVAGTPYTSADPVYNYWRTTMYDSVWRAAPPGVQGFWGTGTTAGGVVDFNVTLTSTSLWMQGFIVYTLGRAQELGFDTGRALDFVVRPFVDIVTESPNPASVGRYRYPVRRVSDSGYFPSHAEALKGYPLATQNDTSVVVTDFEHSYHFIAFTAASFGTSRPNGEAAWGWYRVNIRDPGISKGWASNPKWAILPRGPVGPIPSAPGGFQLSN